MRKSASRHVLEEDRPMQYEINAIAELIKWADPRAREGLVGQLRN